MEKETLLSMYRDMVRIRKFECKIVDDCFPKKEVYGNFHTCIGQEAAVVGAVRALRKTDYLTTTHRGHGHCIAKGMNMEPMMAELFAKETGYCHGRGGSLHVADVSMGILGANGIVGGGIPIATGSALASWIKGSDEVTACFFGDGASNEGTFHESLNMAAIWKLPVVYVCDNNQWACGTACTEVMNTPGVAERAKAYNIPGVRVDGNDVECVYTAVKEACDRARRGEGPSIVELFTFRMRAHNSADKDLRPKSVLDEWREKDPIRLLKARLEGMGCGKELEKLERDADDEIDRAYRFASSSDYPDPGTICDHVYIDDNERCTVR